MDINGNFEKVLEDTINSFEDNYEIKAKFLCAAEGLNKLKDVQFITASTYTEAIESLKENSEIHTVILDLNLDKTIRSKHYGFRGIFMKKVLLILITLFIFVGCANSPNDESKDYFEGLYDHAFCGPESEEFGGYKFCKSTEKNKVELEFHKDENCAYCISTQVLNYKVIDEYAILSSSEADESKTFIKLNYKTKTFEKAIIFYNNNTFDISKTLQSVALNLKY